MGAPETGWFRGEGGSVFPMDLPLPKDIQARVTKGLIVRVTPDGSPYYIPQVSAPATPETSLETVPGPVERPAADADKAAWVGYAVRTLGMDPEAAEAMTVQDLIDKAAEHDVQAQANQESPGGDSVPVKRPAKSADKAAWVAYISQTTDLTEAQAEDLTKDDLVARADNNE